EADDGARFALAQRERRQYVELRTLIVHEIKVAVLHLAAGSRLRDQHLSDRIGSGDAAALQQVTALGVEQGNALEFVGGDHGVETLGDASTRFLRLARGVVLHQFREAVIGGEYLGVALARVAPALELHHLDPGDEAEIAVGGLGDLGRVEVLHAEIDQRYQQQQAGQYRNEIGRARMQFAASESGKGRRRLAPALEQQIKGAAGDGDEQQVDQR